jgi:hypothetical protein
VSRRDVIELACMAVGLAALVSRAVALALTDIDRGLRGWSLDTVPDVVPLWLDEASDL